MKILVCYDIPEDKIRSKAAKYLEGVGRRLQYSVFCVEEDAASFPELCARMSAIVESSDKASVFLTPLCHTCASRSFQIGAPKESSPVCIVA